MGPLSCYYIDINQFKGAKTMSTKPAFWATFRDNETGLIRQIAVTTDSHQGVRDEIEAAGYETFNLHRIERAL